MKADKNARLPDDSSAEAAEKSGALTLTVLPVTPSIPVALAATDGLLENENAVNLAAPGTSSVEGGKEAFKAPDTMTPLLMLMVDVMKYGCCTLSDERTTTQGAPCCWYSELAFATAAFKAAVASTATTLLPGTSDGGGKRLLSRRTKQDGAHKALKSDALEPAAM